MTGKCFNGKWSVRSNKSKCKDQVQKHVGVSHRAIAKIYIQWRHRVLFVSSASPVSYRTSKHDAVMTELRYSSCS